MRNCIAILFSLLACSCSYFKPIQGGSVVDSTFDACPKSDSVFYKGSAVRFCEKLVPKVDSLVSMVAHVHGKPFTDHVVIHICNSQECFDTYTGYGTKVKAGVGRLGLFLSPTVFEKEDYLEFVAHELSHLHLFQQISQVDAYFIPQWFHDGLATYASNGGGANGVTVEEAVAYLKSGKYIFVKESAPFFGERWPISYKMESDQAFQQRMNYRQSALFVEFIDKDGRLQALLRRIEAGNDFSDSFTAVYHEPIQNSWVTFISKIKS